MEAIGALAQELAEAAQLTGKQEQRDQEVPLSWPRITPRNHSGKKDGTRFVGKSEVRTLHPLLAACQRPAVLNLPADEPRGRERVGTEQVAYRGRGGWRGSAARFPSKEEHVILGKAPVGTT